MFKGKKILLTGGAGHLGSFLTEQLVKGGAEVTILERQSHIDAKQANLGDLWNKVKFFWGVCGDPCVRLYHFDVVKDGKY